MYTAIKCLHRGTPGSGMSPRDVSMLYVPAPGCHGQETAVGDTATEAWMPHKGIGTPHFVLAPCSLQHTIACSCLSHTTPPAAPGIPGGHCPPCSSLQPPADQHIPAFLTCCILDLGKGLPVVLHLIHAGVSGSLLLGNRALPSLHDRPAVRATTCVLKVRGCHTLSVQAPLHNLLAPLA